MELVNKLLLDKLTNEEPEPDDFFVATKLKDYILRHNLNNVATNDLLKLFNELGLSVPYSREKLFGCRYIQMSDLIDMPPGQYAHISLEEYAKEFYLRTCRTEIQIDLFVDGASVSKSSNRGIWLILGRDTDNMYGSFIIGCYGGENNPSNFDDFMEPLVKDLEANQVGFRVSSNSN